MTWWGEGPCRSKSHGGGGRRGPLFPLDHLSQLEGGEVAVPEYLQCARDWARHVCALISSSQQLWEERIDFPIFR